MTLGSNEFIHLILLSRRTSNFILLSLGVPTKIFACIFTFLPQKLLTFHAQINKSLNKTKRKKWHESILARRFPRVPSSSASWWVLLLQSGTIINYERFTFDNRDILKNGPFLLLNERHLFNNGYLASCNHTLQWNAINSESAMGNRKSDQGHDGYEHWHLSYYRYLEGYGVKVHRRKKIQPDLNVKS